jgi:hypothetical protein
LLDLRNLSWTRGQAKPNRLASGLCQPPDSIRVRLLRGKLLHALIHCLRPSCFQFLHLLEGRFRSFRQFGRGRHNALELSYGIEFMPGNDQELQVQLCSARVKEALFETLALRRAKAGRPRARCAHSEEQF